MEGNLWQLMLEWSRDYEVLKTWISANHYTCHQTVNELIKLMGQNLLRSLLLKIKNECRPWYSVVAGEATDWCHTEQLNLSIHWVDRKYLVYEEPVGLSYTKAETLFTVIKDLLIRCLLSIDMCWGQVYNGAANMLGHRSAVATQFLAITSAALPVHCYAPLNLCLQGVGRNVICIRDSLELVHEWES